MQCRIKPQLKDFVSERFCDAEAICRVLLLLGFVFKIIYVAQVSYNYSPHDLGELSGSGHLGYIQYLYLNKSLPNTCVGQFYHPPLFHIIGAIVLAVHHVTEDYTAAFESLQLINMIFAEIGVIYGYRNLRKIGNNDWFLVIATAFLSFCPAFYIIGAELNNDCLSTMFLIMALYYTLCWREKRDICGILKIALCIGLGMLSKTNAALIAFAVGLIFLYTLIEDRKEWKRYILQFIPFGVVCIPLGLGWNVYRLLKFRLPLTYVLRLDNSFQYVGDVSALARLGLPTAEQLTSCSIDWNRPADFSNIWGQTFLTMNYDEGILSLNGRFANILGVSLLWISIILSILLLIALFRVLFSSKTELSLKILFPINFFIIFLNYVKFAFDFPHICTMNFRYIVALQVLLMGSAVICRKKQLVGEFFNVGIGVCTVLQSLLATYLYLFYAV